MKTLTLLCCSFLLAGCCTVFKKCPDPLDCPPIKPEVITEYVTLPEHLVVPCVRPAEVPYGTSWAEYINIMDERKSHHNLCADQVDLTRKTNQEYKDAVISGTQH